MATGENSFAEREEGEKEERHSKDRTAAGRGAKTKRDCFRPFTSFRSSPLRGCGAAPLEDATLAPLPGEVFRHRNVLWPG
jgi:hypothetical protein